MDLFGSFTALDWIVVLIVGATASLGLFRGFIAEITSLFSWLAGFAAVRLFYGPVHAQAAAGMGEGFTVTLLAVLAPFLVALVLVRVLGSWASRSAAGTTIGWFDRALGLGFGLVKGFLVASLLFLIITLGLRIVPGDEGRPQWLARARTTPTLALIASAMVSYVGDAWKQPQLMDPHDGLSAGEAGPGSDDAGYNRDDRRSLDKLLDEQEDKTPSTSI